MARVYNRDSKGRFTTKVKVIKPKVVKKKAVKPKVVKKPTKRVYYRDSKGKFTTKAKAVKVQVVKTEAEILKAEGIKTGTYKITKVIDGYGSDRYVVWSNKLEWNKRIAKIKRDYGITEVKGTKTHTYEPFLTEKAIKELLKIGITISS